jgi:hypothetical protein
VISLGAGDCIVGKGYISFGYLAGEKQIARILATINDQHYSFGKKSVSTGG